MLVESETNLGFAGGCNLGVAHATGHYVASSTTTPARTGTGSARPSHVLETRPSVGCVASKVLDWDGRTVDFVDGRHAAATATAYKRTSAQPDDRLRTRRKPTCCSPTGAAMFVRDRGVPSGRAGSTSATSCSSRTSTSAGGCGCSATGCATCPRRSSYPPPPRVDGALSAPGASTTCFERNALYTIYKNYDDDHLDKLLAARASCWRSVEDGAGRGRRHALDLETGAVGRRRPDDAGAEADDGRRPFAVDTFVEQSAGAGRRPREIQAARRPRRHRAPALVPHAFAWRTSHYPSTAKPSTISCRPSASKPNCRERRRGRGRHRRHARPRAWPGPRSAAWNMAEGSRQEHDVKLVTKSICEVVARRLRVSRRHHARRLARPRSLGRRHRLPGLPAARGADADRLEQGHRGRHLRPVPPRAARAGAPRSPRPARPRSR